MTTDSRDVTSVLERVLSAYGFTMQKELSEKLGIASNNISSWLKRGSVPASVLVQCAMDTGSDVTWLVTGEFAKSNLKQGACEAPSLSGKALHEKILSSGGKPVLKRILDAYGFDTQKELADYLDIPTATISTWVRRDYFPGDVVLACALQTGRSLEWLALGESIKHHANLTIENNKSICIKRFTLSSGHLIQNADYHIDISLLPTPSEIDDIICVFSKQNIFLIDQSVKLVANGIWLVSVDGSTDIYSIEKRTGGNVFLKGNPGFVCSISDIVVLGMVFAKVFVDKTGLKDS